MLRFPDGCCFSQGACTFLYRPATDRDVSPRIIVPVVIETIETLAIVDTGGVYLVCDPQLAEGMNFDPSERLYAVKLNIRGRVLRGDVYRVSLTLKAEDGHGSEIEATAFVPRLGPGQIWPWPSFMGLQGCLERLRFAIDPGTNTFYFAPLTEEG